VTELDRSPPEVHILIVDDEPNILRSLTRSLGRSYRITTCNTGAEALTLLAKDGSFDVVLCDLTMPGLDGVGLFERLNAVAPGLQDRLLFLTAGVVTQRTQAFLDRENPKLLYKPVDLQELCDAIDALGRRAPA